MSIVAAVVLLAAIGVLGMWGFAGADPWRALAAIAAVHALGYVTGSLLVAPESDRTSLSFATLRLVCGLLLSTVGFLLSLLLAVSWFAGPAALLAAAVAVHGRSAFALPRPQPTFSWGGAVAAALATVVLAPIVIASFRMAPGDFPPVFFHVDTAYFLEKVHALVRTNSYPPESLSFVGGLQTYHYGAQGVAALIARSSGLAPHHVLFLIVLPLLAVGILAAALAAAERLSPTLPTWVTVPMLLVPVPTLWYHFWAEVGPALAQAVSLRALGPLERLVFSYEIWNVTLNPGHNIAAQFITLASLAGVIGASTHGWRLPVFLVGSAFVFKAPTGIALCAGLGVALVCHAVASRSLRPLLPGAAAAAVFALVYGALFVVPGVMDRASVLDPVPFYHLRMLERREQTLGFVLDMLWLFLPVAVLFVVGRPYRWGRTLPLLAAALVPLVLVNTFQLIDGRPGMFGVDDNWLQVLVPVPFLIHAVALSLAGDSWARLGRGARAAFLVTMAATILPPVYVGARYAQILVVNPAYGHEFVDNRPLAAALATIPVEGSLVVTNDLRYPADNFRRDGRQMQIPALFGHGAFAVNFAYEYYPFSGERRAAQGLLREAEWSAAIDDAARKHGWTHLLIRNDYGHPDPIPIEEVFDNGTYSVYRFPEGAAAAFGPQDARR